MRPITSFANWKIPSDLHTKECACTYYSTPSEYSSGDFFLDYLTDAFLSQSIPLQTGFLKGMERILGVSASHREQTISEEISSPGRNDVNEADELSRRANEPSEQKRGLSRTFFEPVDEGQVSRCRWQAVPFEGSLMQSLYSGSCRTAPFGRAPGEGNLSEVETNRLPINSGAT